MGDTQLSLQRFSLETAVDIDFDAQDVARNLKPTQIADLIMQLDDEVGQWEHTLLLYHYFAAQFEIARSKAPELVDLSMEDLREMMLRDQEEDQEEEKEAANG